MAKLHASGPGSIEYWLDRLDPELFATASLDDRQAAARSMKRAHFAALAIKSAKARAARKAQK
jgi:hypothetical protein